MRKFRSRGCMAAHRLRIRRARSGALAGTPDARASRMPQPSVRCYDYVNQRYSRVRDALLANPNHVFRHATAAAAAHAARLHLRIGALEIGTEVEIQIVSVEHDFAYDRPATRLVMRWQAADRPRAFPSMVATLTLFALTPTETQLAVDGIYEPPLGKL